MSSILMLKEAAEALGFSRIPCPLHPQNSEHVVYERTAVIQGRSREVFWRVHTDMDLRHRRTHINGSDTPRQLVSMRNAMDFMRKASQS